MEIKYIKRDLFETEGPIIVHGCNAQGVMGSGVARIVKEKYPEAYNVYRATYEDIGLELGMIIPKLTFDKKLIVNAITQEYYGRDGKQYVSYEAVRECLKRIVEYITLAMEIDNSFNYSTIAMPKIGCGLGGGDWAIVCKIIEEELCEKGFEVLIYEL